MRAPQPTRTEASFLTASEVRDLAEAINPWFRIWVYFAAYTPLERDARLRRKDFADFDLLRRTVTVERQLLEVQSRFVGFGPPKRLPLRRRRGRGTSTPSPAATYSSTDSGQRHTITTGGNTASDPSRRQLTDWREGSLANRNPSSSSLTSPATTSPTSPKSVAESTAAVVR